MSGVTKHIYDKEIRDIIVSWDKQMETIMNLLPQIYTKSDVINALKQYYPHEWKYVQDLYDYYQKKDKHIKKHNGKTRYEMPQPIILLEKSNLYQKIMSDSYRTTYEDNYSSSRAKTCADDLWEKRKPKIERISIRIEDAIRKTQKVTPDFIDQMMGLYERKNTKQKDKVYILYELKKYYNKKVVNFFFKTNDTELNMQLRDFAFYYLQSIGYRPRKRRQKYMQVHSKNKKRKAYLRKEYPYERFDISGTPEELEYRINNGKEQMIKSFDFFISHSYLDSAEVQQLINYENGKGKTIFCDWISDSDYLKRTLLCEATLKVLENRLDNSKALIFVKSYNSLRSKWCEYELEYFSKLNKPMFCISKEDISDGKFDITDFQ